ncbi:MAG: type II secretion system protein GspN [Cryobacterium sp.]|nr:type II secretion system protein GspN [Oligoflexia bacterium]
MAAETEMMVTEELEAGGWLRAIGLTFLFFISLIVFTAVKVPQSKIHGWIVGTLNQQMAPLGMQVTTDEGHLSLGLGLKYEMTGVRITKMLNQKTIKFTRLEVAPSILPLLSGKLGGTFRLEESAGVVSGKVLTHGEEFDATLNIENVNLGRMGILPFLADVEGTADVKGTVEINGVGPQTSSYAGKIELNLAKIVVDNQKLGGFEIPRTSIADGVVNIAIGGGKATVNSFRLGKAGGTDDLNATLSGDVKLMKMLDASDANLKLKVGFSDRYKQEKTISVLDSLLGMFKLADGTFAMKFMGPLYAAQPSPDHP